MKKIGVLAIITVLLFACGASRITSSWKEKDSPARQFEKIMVVALMNTNDAALKTKMENHLVGDLKAAGYEAVSCMVAYGPKAFEDMNEEKVLQQIRDKGFDAVMTIVLLSKQQEKDYVPEKVYYSPYAVYHNRFWGYYTTIYQRIETPGYYGTTTRYFWESNLYEMKEMKLLYSVQTESFQPASATALAHEYGNLIVDDMLKKAVLLRKPTEAAGK